MLWMGEKRYNRVMEPLYFVTSNPGKVESLKSILREVNAGRSIEMLKANYPEDKSHGTTEHVASQGARWCADKFNKEVLVSDVGLFIPILNGWPGINTAFTLKRIGIEGVLKLMAGIPERSAEWTLSLAYAKPNIEATVFTASLRGAIAGEARGSDGFGFDPIFIPEGQEVTLAQDTYLRDKLGPFRQAVESFVSWHTSANVNPEKACATS